MVQMILFEKQKERQRCAKQINIKRGRVWLNWEIGININTVL